MKHPKIYLFDGDPKDEVLGFYLIEGYNIENEWCSEIPLPVNGPTIAINLARHMKMYGESLIEELVDTIVHELSHWAN